ncbi:transposase [Clostridium fessum]|uniref:transposase n=1 Tax=Clostridium fessum TaxID=2126740 RepID=UPI001D0EAFD6|nr:transposase [Clostridium fessum]MCC2169486.1 transposase [Clostridium fessum]
MRSRNSVKVKRDHKDTLFRMIFSTRENLLSLYNAVNHSHYTDASELEIVTLKNAVYMNMKNDQAFLLDMQLNLYEHQSTWNPNMPLRFLMYVAKEYQMLVRNQTLYASALVKVPTPHFVVFYNGETEQEAETILRLSHSFQQKTDKPELELMVRVLNINLDKKQEVLEACQLLKEYMLLVNKIRRYTDEYKDINQAVEQAVTECIEENILADFLRKNRAEAIEMCIFEYDDKREKELIRKAEYAEGMKEGERIGREAGKKEEAERIFNIYQLFRANYTENQIKEKLGMNVEEVRKILERFK